MANGKHMDGENALIRTDVVVTHGNCKAQLAKPHKHVKNKQIKFSERIVCSITMSQPRYYCCL